MYLCYSTPVRTTSFFKMLFKSLPWCMFEIFICVSIYFRVNIKVFMIGNDKIGNGKFTKPISIFTQRKCSLCSTKCSLRLDGFIQRASEHFSQIIARW